MQRYDNMQPYGIEQSIILTLKGLRSQAGGEARRSASARRAAAAQEKQTQAELGFTASGKGKGKKSGSSRGGHVRRNLRAVLSMTG